MWSRLEHCAQPVDPPLQDAPSVRDLELFLRQIVDRCFRSA
jgi:hypothetical protein